MNFVNTVNAGSGIAPSWLSGSRGLGKRGKRGKRGVVRGYTVL
jgi:hypothetical protein